MNLSANHPAALGFRTSVLGAAHQDAALYHVVFRAWADETFGLVVQITALPAAAFHAIRMGPCPQASLNGPLLSPGGQALWDQLHAIALRVVRQSLPAGSLAALILQPEAIDHARESLRLARAA